MELGLKKKLIPVDDRACSTGDKHSYIKSSRPRLDTLPLITRHACTSTASLRKLFIFLLSCQIHIQLHELNEMPILNLGSSNFLVCAL